MGKLPAAPGMLWWYLEPVLEMFAQRMQVKSTEFPACNQTEPYPPGITIITSPCTDIPRHEGFCPEDAAKASTFGCEILVVPITGQRSQSLLFSSEDVLCGDLQLPARRNKPLEKP